VKPYLLVLFLLLLVTGVFAASAQPAQLVALASRNSKIVQAAGAPTMSSRRRTATLTA